MTSNILQMPLIILNFFNEYLDADFMIKISYPIFMIVCSFIISLFLNTITV